MVVCFETHGGRPIDCTDENKTAFKLCVAGYENDTDFDNYALLYSIAEPLCFYMSTMDESYPSQIISDFNSMWTRFKTSLNKALEKNEDNFFTDSQFKRAILSQLLPVCYDDFRNWQFLPYSVLLVIHILWGSYGRAFFLVFCRLIELAIQHSRDRTAGGYFMVFSCF